MVETTIFQPKSSFLTSSRDAFQSACRLRLSAGRAGGARGGAAAHETNDAPGIRAALTSIATSLTACTWVVPQVAPGTADGGALNVVIAGVTIPQVAGPSACAGRGWWYVGHDVISLCPASCAANADAGVTTQLGCPTQH